MERNVIIMSKATSGLSKSEMARLVKCACSGSFEHCALAFAALITVVAEVLPLTGADQCFDAILSNGRIICWKLMKWTDAVVNRNCTSHCTAARAPLAANTKLLAAVDPSTIWVQGSQLKWKLAQTTSVTANCPRRSVRDHPRQK